MSPELAPGKMLDRYRVEEKLGEGGMGRVFRAVDTRLGRTVAIKIVNAEFTQRFEREARAISALNHPHICTLHDVGEHEGAPYLVMEYVDGKPLKGPLPVSDALRYAVQTGQALAAAHKAGIVHRDLKPDNILLTSQGNVKVLDFGLAKLQPAAKPDARTITLTTEQGTIAGTGPYMSPEQAQGEPVDARSDIFSFGAVLYELLSGRQAFRRETIGATLAAVLAAEPPPLRDAPPEVARVVAKMLAKTREGRYQSAEAVLADLGAAAQPGFRFLPRRLWFGQRLRWARAAVGALLLAVALIAGSVWWPRAIDAVALERAEAYLQRYDRRGNVDRAIDVLRPAWWRRNSPSAAVQARLAEAYVRKFRQTQDKKWLQMGLESGQRAVASNPLLEAGYVALGAVLAASGQRAEAAKQFERARNLNPRSGPAHLGLAKLSSGPEAEGLHLKAVEYSRNWITLGELATFYHVNTRYSESIQRWRQALDLVKDSVMVLSNLAGELNMNGQYEEAGETFQRALLLDDTDPRTWANLGTARYFQGDYGDAVRAMKKATELAPQNYRYWGNLGDSYRWAKGTRSGAGPAYEEAIKLVRRQLAATPEDSDVRSSLAVYLAKSGETRGALAELALVEKAQGRDKGTLFKTALVYELAGDHEMALKALGRAVEAGYSMHEIANEPELAALRSDARYFRIASPKAAR